MNARNILQIAALAGLLAALVFALRGQWDAVLVAAALSSVAWFVRMRMEIKAMLLPIDEVKQTPEINDEN